MDTLDLTTEEIWEYAEKVAKKMSQIYAKHVDTYEVLEMIMKYYLLDRDNSMLH